MFGFLKKKNVTLKSICIGKVIPIEQVEDKMFAEKMLGDGVGFQFEGNTIYAPCDGEIILAAPTNHAFGIKSENGAEILIHCGLDTVNLNGEGLKRFVKAGEKVKSGQKLLEVDVDFIKQKNISLTTPMILTSMESYSIEFIKNDGNVTLDDDIVNIIKK